MRKVIALLMLLTRPALGALVLFPFFSRLRSTLADARIARVLQGTQRWQI